MTVALWMGDSFTRGEGAEVGEAATYPYLVSTELGWDCQVDAQNGTGFVNDGYLAGWGLAPLGERLEANRDRVHADIVIVDAGRNDAGYPPAAVRESVRCYVAALDQAYPHARVAIVAPTLLAAAQPPEYTAIGELLSSLAPAVGAQVVDPARSPQFSADGCWHELVCGDGFHPSAAGQRHYAAVLTALLRPHLAGNPAEG
ncbi:MAG: hypothetical protein CSA58_00470 [Micrococcales bacterium]|nr:MAG: hypothetical protein CSB46_00160 [Micrococcales bacterium]PIE28162.1 MAG: hypothetical protein CSA58_00470 [Micrococcales bacterium]